MLSKAYSFISRLSPEKNSTELVSKGASALLFRLIGLLLSYLFTLLVTKKYGVDAWGVFTLFFAMIQILSKLARFGFDKGAIKFISEYRVQKNQNALSSFYFLMVAIVFILTLIFSLALFYCSSIVAELIFKDISAAYYVKIASICLIPFSLTMINAFSLKALKKIKEGAFLGHTMLFSIAITSLLLLDIGSNGALQVIYALTLSIYLGCLISFILWFRISKVSLFSGDSSVKVREIFKVTIPLIFAGSLFLLMGWADTFMLGYFKSEQEVGAYNIITKIARFSTLIIVAIDSIFSPKISEFSTNNQFDGLEKLAIYGSRLTFFLTLPILILICTFPNFILGIFHEDLQDELIVYSLIIVAAAKFVNAICGNVGSLLQLTGKQVAYQNIVLTSLGINLILNYILIPPYGIIGASIASFISISLNNLLGLFFVKKYFGINASFIQHIFLKK